MKRGILSLVAAGAVALGEAILAPSAASAQAGGETFTATASAKSADASATAKVTVAIERFATEAERAALVKALKEGGTAAARPVLSGMKDSGYLELGQRRTPIKYAYARSTGSGRLITVVTAQPILFLGAGLPEAKPKSGYDFAVAILDLDASGKGEGELAPAAKVKMNESGAVVIDDYGAEKVWLKSVAPAK